MNAITMPVMHAMRKRFGDRIYGRGIDVGITLLSAENLRSGAVWRWFMRDEAIREGLARASTAAARVPAVGQR